MELNDIEYIYDYVNMFNKKPPFPAEFC